MAGSLNQVQLIGHLGADPEIRSLTSGDRVANLRVATSETWKDRAGERKEKTEWHRVVIFNEHLVKVAESYLRKGSQVFIQGAIQTRKWKNQAGDDQYSTEVVLQKFNGVLTMLGKKEAGDGGRDGYAGGGGYSGGGDGGFSGQDARGSPREEFSADLDDEIPF